MTHKRNILDLDENELNPIAPIGILICKYVNDGTHIGETYSSHADNQYPSSTVTFAMLISESIYKLVVGIERIIQWFGKAILQPCLAQLR